jgi:cell division protein FtsL
MLTEGGGTLAEAQSRAHGLLEQVLRQQASVVAFEKVFLTMGITFALALPLLLLFRTGRARGGGAAH